MIKKAVFKKIILRCYIAFIFLFLYVPIAVLIFFSFNKARGRGIWTGFTLEWYKRLFSNELILQSFVNTIIVALISSIIATILGTMGVSLMLLFVIMKLKFGFTTLILAHITFNTPYVILNVLPKLRQQDNSLYEAALDLGCPPFLAFWKVVIPDILPGIIAGFLMALTYSLDDFIISYFTTGITSQTLPITIFSMTRKRISPEINAISTVIFVIVLVSLVIMNLKEIKKEKYLIQLKRKLNKN